MGVCFCLRPFQSMMFTVLLPFQHPTGTPGPTSLLFVIWLFHASVSYCKRLIFALDAQDGDVSDHADVLDSVVKASELPISIVVAGLKGPVSGDGWLGLLLSSEAWCGKIT